MKRAVDWLWGAAQEFNQLELGRAFYQRVTGRPCPAAGPVPALPHPGLDQIAQRLLAPNPRDRYASLEALRWDLEMERWKVPDFLAASGMVREQPAQPALVGRRLALEQLLQLPKGLTLLVGPAGMGKTLLLQEAGRHALATDRTVWRAECLQRSQISWQPFQDLAAELARRPEHWVQVQARLGDWLPAVLRLFPVLRRLSTAQAEPFSSVEFLGERNRQASLALLSAMGPAIFVVDDLHWADPEVVEVLSQLNWPVLAGGRATLVQASRVLALGALESVEIGRLARSMCGPVECPELFAWSQGHPLLAASLLRNLCDSGALRIENNVWTRGLQSPSWGALTPNLEEVLRLRCSNLSGKSQRLLRRAALLLVCCPRRSAVTPRQRERVPNGLRGRWLG